MSVPKAGIFRDVDFKQIQQIITKLCNVESCWICFVDICYNIVYICWLLYTVYRSLIILCIMSFLLLLFFFVEAKQSMICAGRRWQGAKSQIDAVWIMFGANKLGVGASVGVWRPSTSSTRPSFSKAWPSTTTFWCRKQQVPRQVTEIRWMPMAGKTNSGSTVHWYSLMVG